MPRVSLTGVSCSSARACIAVGFVPLARGRQHGFVERWNGSIWQAETAPEPKGARDTFFNGVSCSSATVCTVVGGAGGALRGKTLCRALERVGLVATDHAEHRR